MTRNEYNKLKELHDKGLVSDSLFNQIMKDVEETNTEYGTCGDMINGFYQYLKNRAFAEKTAKSYVLRVRKAMRFQKEIDDANEVEREAFTPFTTKMINDFIISQSLKECAKSTLTTYLVALKTFNEYCKEKDIPCFNKDNIMAISFTNTTLVQSYDNYFTNKEVEEMIDYAYKKAEDLTEKSVAIIISLIWELMLQKNVIRSLKLTDYDKETNTLSFEERGVKQKLLLSEKTGRILSNYIEQMLDEIPCWYRFRTKELRNPKVDNLLFQTRVTEKVSDTTIFDRLVKFGEIFFNGKDKRTISNTNLITSRKIYLLSIGCSFEEVNKQARINDRCISRYYSAVQSLYPQSIK